jgi:hypothetical protein
MREPLLPSQIKRLLVAILEIGTLSFTSHAYEEMANDDLTEVDVQNVLRGGVAGPGELRSGSYRYPVKTSRIAAVIAFRSEAWAVVITAWRFKSTSQHREASASASRPREKERS